MLRGDWSPNGRRKISVHPQLLGFGSTYLFMILVFAGQSCNVNIKKLAGSMATPDHDRTCGFFDHVNCLTLQSGLCKVGVSCMHS